MYPSNSNGDTTISCSGQPIFHRPFLSTDINPNFKLDDPSSSLFHFPSPYIHYEDDAIFRQHLHDLLLQQQPSTADETVAETVINMADSSKDDVDGLKEDCNKKCDRITEKIPRKRSSKKDRHSKINTAHGPRDRRMRLSLEVARKFFGLQDVLGFDKASKTVEWLLIKSRSAIKELARGLPQLKHSCSTTVAANSASSTSECEVVSGIGESNFHGNQQASITTTKMKPSCTKDKKIRAFRKTEFHPIARESRERARQRARERTREKRRLGESKLSVETTNHDLNRLGSWSTFETGEESGTQSHNMNPSSFEGLTEVEEPTSHKQQFLGTREDNIVGESLVSTSNWSPSIVFNYQHHTGISHEHQFTDFYFYGKPWEAYNNTNL